MALTKMSTNNIFLGGKGDRCLGLATLPSSFGDCPEIWQTQLTGIFRACTGIAVPCDENRNTIVLNTPQHFCAANYRFPPCIIIISNIY